MAHMQITIVGLGETGTSLGLALQLASKEITIVGHDKDPAVAAAARKAGAVHRSEWNLPAACRGAGMVILSLPLPAIRDTMAAIAPDLAEGCLVTDTAPLKVPVLAWARELLPSHVAFVGGDPVTARGREGAPRADLFQDGTYCLCPEPSTSAEAVDRAADLAMAVGGKPLYIDPAEHDGMMAGLHQLPFLLSAAALHAASSGPAWRDLATLGSARLTQLLDLMGDSPNTELAAAAANAENIGRWLERMQAALGDLQTLLAQEPAAFEDMVKRLLDARALWDRCGADAPPPMPKRGFGLKQMFLGNRS